MDDQNQVDFNQNREGRADYAKNYGENLANYTNMALTMNGYDGMATSNNNTGIDTSPLIQQNNQKFIPLDKENGDNQGFSPESVEELFRWAIWRDTGLQAEEVPTAMAESIKSDVKKGAQVVVDNAPTVLGAAALAVPHPGTKAVLSASSVLVGVAQDLENGDLNNTLGAGVGSLVQVGLVKIGVPEPVADKINFGVSEAVSRNVGENSE